MTEAARYAASTPQLALDHPVKRARIVAAAQAATREGRTYWVAMDASGFLPGTTERPEPADFAPVRQIDPDGTITVHSVDGDPRADRRTAGNLIADLTNPGLVASWARTR